MTADTPIEQLKGVGGEVAKKLEILGISTVGELIDYYPRRYEDYSKLTAIRELQPGQVTIQAAISSVTGRFVRRGMHMTEAIASDETGSIKLIWFNQPYRAAAIRPGQQYYVAGEYSLSRGRFSMINPSCELVSDFPINTARIIPIYKETKGLKSATLRKLVKSALTIIDGLDETLPEWILKSEELVNYARAVTEMHFPSSGTALATAQKRLGFEEVFGLSLAALMNKYEMLHDEAIAVPFNEELAVGFVASLPFKLTDAQRKTIWQVYKDISRTQPANRLIEGDVGSGKTVVAAMAAIMAIRQGFQVALMAPTEILARQHAQTLFDLLKNIGFEHHVGLLLGSLSAAQKKLMQEKISSGEVMFVVGTHALISENVDMHRLGLIIVDEQHRFGVQQRKKLQAKAGHMPHVLHLTATPIPRSLALTLYGELDISVIDELPKNRKRIHTELCSPNSRSQLNARITAELEAGRQAFFVCPMIVESEIIEANSVEKTFERVAKKDFKTYRVGLLHGKMKTAEKEAVMEQYLLKKLDILVSTTVIEVGVDVPNASVMVIESAERFGLAQIHQLRGRVGRSEHQSYCFLVPTSSQSGLQRLRLLETTHNGFELAELDLKLRGPGAIYGLSQHGELDLRVAKLSDMKLIMSARSSAQKFIDKGENLLHYRHLARRVKALRAITNLN